MSLCLCSAAVCGLDFTSVVPSLAVRTELYVPTLLCIRDHCAVNTEWHKKTGTFEKPNKNWRNPRKKKFVDRNRTTTTCLL